MNKNQRHSSLLSVLLFFTICGFSQPAPGETNISFPKSSDIVHLNFDSLFNLQNKFDQLPKELALAYANELERKAAKISPDSLQINAWINIARMYIYFDMEKIAEPYVEKAMSKTRKTTDFEREARINTDLGIFCGARNKDSLAMVFYTNAILLADKTKDLSLLTKPYTDITVIFLKRGMNDKCIRFANDGLQIAERTGNKRMEIELRNAIGQVTDRQGKYHTSIEQFNRSLTLAYEIKDSALIYHCLGKLCEDYIELKQMDSANYYGDKLEDMLIRSGAKEVYPYTALGHLNVERKNYPLAIRYARIAIANKYKPWPPYSSFLVMYKAYKGLNNTDSALAAYEKYWELYSPKLIAEKDNLVLEVEQQFQQYRKDNEIALLKKDKTLGKTQRNGAFIVAALLAVAAFLFYNRFRLKKKTSDALAVKNKEIEKQKEVIQSSLGEKETLLREIHHRVKNNLQIISSLLNIQSSHIQDENVLSSIQEGQNRVQAMSLIHQNLYQSEHLSNVDIQNYLHQLVAYLSETFAGQSKDITVTVDAPNINFDIDTAIPLGLIINELVSNAYKYAFDKHGKGNINISIKPKSGDDYELEIRDDGKGLPTDTDMEKSSSLGLKLVKILSRQLRGTFSSRSDKGAVFLVQFKDLRAYQASQS
jgi:two-component sensor histidine kinase